MEDYFGNIEKIKPEYLLKATPFSKETTINFCHMLPIRVFFDELYTERTKNKQYQKENDDFDKRINYLLQDIGNQYAKVNVLHIAGYAGCGKTTYLHHLLWENREIFKTYELIDYEGCKTAVQPFIERAARTIIQLNKTELCNYLDMVANKQIFNVTRFQEHLNDLLVFSRMLKTIDQTTAKEYTYYAKIEKFGYEMQCAKTFLSFMFFVTLLLLLFEKCNDKKRSSMILVIDNADSMSTPAEEAILLPLIKQFANNCTYFFDANLTNDIEYNGEAVSMVFNNTKLVIIITTRIATFKRYESLDPDWERIYGWISIAIPENYYDHEMIINKKIDYFMKSSQTQQLSVVKELQLIKSLSAIAYHNLNFLRLFNGSVRSCIEMLCNIVNEFPHELLTELCNLYSYSLTDHNTDEGVSGYLLWMILYIFKKEHIFDYKLGLSYCRKGNTVSLSRIILTIIRENERRCSLFRVFQVLNPLGFQLEEICSTIWNLCEVGRDTWRRLLVFDHIVPKSLEELLRQVQAFQNEDDDVEHYSELVICTSGLAYMEFVIPHFEFMLCRQEMGKQTIKEVKYTPLFACDSEKMVQTKRSHMVYNFEKKIDIVFRGIKTCCYNSFNFSNRVLKVFRMTRKDYIKYTSLNYHTVGWNGEPGLKQSYEARLIFRNIGYIEKYRRYLLNKHKDLGKEYLADINKRIVDRIVRFIKLYQDSTKCFQTEIQNTAAEELLYLTQKIKMSGYYDFNTQIETKN